MDFSPDKWRAFLAVALLSAASAALAVLPDTREPIALDADSSEFDRDSGALLFSNVQIRQGTLSIAAETAKANDLDFADNAWDFRGKVRIDGEASRIRSDNAVLRFRDHRLVHAAVEGRPATFQRDKTQEFRALEGGADLIEYDLVAGTLLLKGNATIVDGKNEINGAVLRYDLVSQKLVATSDESGGTRVRITVTPQTLGLEEQNPPPEPGTGDGAGNPPPEEGR